MRILLKRNSGMLLVAGLLLLCSCSSDQQQSDSANEKGTPVKITHPVKADLTEYLNLNANTVFLNKEIVRATFQGFIDKIYKNIGDEVDKGDRLFLIKTRESAATDSMKIDLGDGLFKGAVTIRAQSNGILTELDYHDGDYVTDGEQIAIISDPSSLHINLNVPYQYSNMIEKHSQCEIILPDGRILGATIQKIIPAVDPNSQTQKYLLRLNQKVNLPENLNVNAKLPIEKAADALSVNRDAVLSNETMTDFWIMKLINDSTAVRVNIRKGIESDSLVQVLNPKLNLSDRIVYSGSYGLPDTAKVSVMNQ